MVFWKRKQRGAPASTGGQFDSNEREDAPADLDDVLDEDDTSDAAVEQPSWYGRRDAGVFTDESIPTRGISPDWYGRAISVGMSSEEAIDLYERETMPPRGDTITQVIATRDYDDLPEGLRVPQGMTVPWMLRVTADGGLTYRHDTQHVREVVDPSDPLRRRGSVSMGVRVVDGKALVYLDDQDFDHVVNPGYVVWGEGGEDLPVLAIVRKPGATFTLPTESTDVLASGEQRTRMLGTDPREDTP